MFCALYSLFQGYSGYGARGHHGDGGAEHDRDHEDAQGQLW